MSIHSFTGQLRVNDWVKPLTGLTIVKCPVVVSLIVGLVTVRSTECCMCYPMEHSLLHDSVNGIYAHTVLCIFLIMAIFMTGLQVSHIINPQIEIPSFYTQLWQTPGFYYYIHITVNWQQHVFQWTVVMLNGNCRRAVDGCDHRSKVDNTVCLKRVPKRSKQLSWCSVIVLVLHRPRPAVRIGVG